MVRRTAVKGSPLRRRIIASDSDDVESDTHIEKQEKKKKEHIEVVITNAPTIGATRESAQVSPRKVTALTNKFSSLNVNECLDKDGQIEIEKKVKVQENEPMIITKTGCKVEVDVQKIPLESFSSSFVYSPSSRMTYRQMDIDKTPTERLMISHLVLTNFKSYAGRQCIGPFHPSFSSIVGPNGSGKSNVIDALLFVFGFRASQMRQSKISALIHKSLAHPDLEWCSVEIHFEEIQESVSSNCSDVKYITKPGSRMVISRKAFKNNTSKYMINNHESSYAEIAAFLQRLNRVSVVKKEKDGLEARKETVLSYIKDENLLTTKQSKLYQAYVFEYEKNVETAKDQIKKLKETMDIDESKHKINIKTIKELEKLHEKMLKEHENLKNDIINMQKEFMKHDQENIKLQEKQKYLIQKQKKNNNLIQTNSHSYSECITWIENYVEEIKSYEKDVSDLKNKLELETKELEKVRFDIKDKTQDISDELEIKQKQLEPWIEQVNSRQSMIDIINSEIKILVNKENTFRQEIHNIQEKIRIIEEDEKTTKKTIQMCEVDKKNKENELLVAKEEFEKMKEEERRFKEKLSLCHQKEDEAKASFSKFQNHNSVLTGLMKLKESGRVTGFYGRLGSLGTIPDKYDIAISTACPSLNHMVVETVEAGQQCIEYLRENNLGRAVFIVLSRLPSKSMERIETPENVPRLFDLITLKEKKFALAFFNALQHTLVAEDLQQANRIAYGKKRWRVVTLDGQLIDKSGTMTGGGNKVLRGGMSSKLEPYVSNLSIKKYEQDRKIIEEAYQTFNSKYISLRNRIDDMIKEIPELDVKISILLLELSTYNNNIIDAKKTLKEVSLSYEASFIDIEKKKELENEVSNLEKENEATRKNMVGIEQEIKRLQDRIMDIGGIRLRSQKAKVDNIQDQLNTIYDRISNADISKIKKEKDKIKFQKAIDDSKNELQTIETQLSEVKVSISKKAKLIDNIRCKIEKTEEEMNEKTDELAETKLKLNKEIEINNAARVEEIEIKNKLEEYNKILFDNEKKLKYWKDKLKSLKLLNVDQIVSEFYENSEQLMLQIYSKEELESVDQEKLKTEISALEERTQNIKIEFDVLEEYKKKEKEYKSRSEDLENTINERNSVRLRLTELKQTRLNEFMIGFNSISLKLKEMYQMITMGGNAELELVDSLDPFSEGILFSVMPPKKSWKNISNLSGGEKTLSSLALVFALHHYKPTPLYVMDEIDAALDFRNVSIIANYIKDRTKNAQLIVISLRNNMFELASRLIGHLQGASFPGMGRAHGYPAEANIVRRPEAAAQPGLAVLQLLQFIDGLSSTQKVVAEGNLCVQFTPALLKMEWFEFITLRYDEYVLRDAVCSNAPASLVNDLGITRKVMRCLEMGESLADMYALMTASQVNRLGPLKTLSNFSSSRERADGLEILSFTFKDLEFNSFNKDHHQPSLSVSSIGSLKNTDCVLSSSDFSSVLETKKVCEEILFTGRKFEKLKITNYTSKNNTLGFVVMFLLKTNSKIDIENTLDVNKIKKNRGSDSSLGLDYNIIDRENSNYNYLLKEYSSDENFLDDRDIVIESNENPLEKLQCNLYNRSNVNIHSKSNYQVWKNDIKVSRLNRRFRDNYNSQDKNCCSFHMLNSLKDLKKNVKRRRQKINHNRCIERDFEVKDENKERIEIKKTLRELLLNVNNVVCRFISDCDLMELDLISMDSQARRWIHMLVKAYGISSKSYGTGKSRHVVLYKTTKIHDNYSKQHVNRVLQSLNHNQYNRRVYQIKNYKSKSSGEKIFRNKNENKYHDGDIVGKNVPEIDKNNRGRKMLEKLGWVEGNGLGAPDNKGIEAPIVAIIKTTKLGLR
ncbi:hypothetical protein PORY_001605 [Pneumocystis oryctolagi]|uniref:Uncharacterized protein n=1 Tax=Pneumocystis oryctolagi TaxID=42067 RepID=A0ACB7CD06_9ASCO|nr:hypothetical protein PORY_001605 [Pneumocystis oryctolagi]